MNTNAEPPPRAQVTAQTIGAAKEALNRAKRSTMAGGIAALIPVHVPQRFESRASDIASILFCAFVSCVLTILVRLAWRRTVRTIAWPAGNARFQMSATTELGQLADMEGLQMIAKSHPNEEVPRRAQFLVRAEK